MMLRKIICFFKRVRNKLSSYKNLLVLKIFQIKHGKNCVIHGKLGLQIPSSASITIGDNFYMSNRGGNNPLCSNLEGFIYAEEKALISIGHNVGMSSTTLWAAKCITIGSYVKIGANVKIIDNDAHSLGWYVRRNVAEDEKSKHSAPILIEDDVLIGMNSIVLKGVTIGARSVIGAGSVVTRNIPADCIAAGNPCKVIKKLGGI